MTTEGKVWGRTTEVARTETASVHYLEILAGGYSSKHRHRIKKNKFHVTHGAVKVSAWRSRKTADETILRAGDALEIEPGIWHKFEALEESQMIEVYTTALESPDIERAGTGGILTPADRDPRLNLQGPGKAAAPIRADREKKAAGMTPADIRRDIETGAIRIPARYLK